MVEWMIPRDGTRDPSMKQRHLIALLLVFLSFPDSAFFRAPLAHGFRNRSFECPRGSQPTYRNLQSSFLPPLRASHGELLGVPESRGDTIEGSNGKNVSQLLHKAGVLSKVAPGLHVLLPVGQKIMSRLERVLRVEMARIGAHEFSLPILQPEGVLMSRVAEFGSDLYKVVDRHGRSLHLSPTCEELACLVARLELSPLSKSQLPMRLYQINTKFRDEMRPSDTGMRCREFAMKDAYSFHADADSAFSAYTQFKEAYTRIMDALQIEYVISQNVTDTRYDEEFHVTLYVDGEPVEVEVAHLFQLGTTLSTEAGLTYEDKGREEKPVYLNSYGIGLQRLLYAAISQHYDNEGLRVPQLIAPYDVAIVLCERSVPSSKHLANALQHTLAKRGLHPFLDDRDVPIKDRVADLRTIGVPHIVYVSNSLNGADSRAPPEDVVEKIKRCADTSNSYHLWQSEASIVARNDESKSADILEEKVRYMWRAADGEYVISVSELMELLRV